MPSPNRILLALAVIAASTLRATAQQSIAESVAQLKADVARLQGGLPAVAAAGVPGAAPAFAVKDIDFGPGLATFKNTNGLGIASIGTAADGSGGLWAKDSSGKQLFSITTKVATHHGSLQLSSEGLLSVWLESLDNGSGIGRFFAANGQQQASIGGTAEGKGGGAWFYDGAGKNLIYVGASTIGTPRVTLSRSDGTQAAILSEDGGGKLSLYTPANKEIVELGSAEGNGYAIFNSSTGDRVVSIGTSSADATKGSVWIKGNDYAEIFDTAGSADISALTPGSVVAASLDGEGIVLAHGAYDPAVVGVLSGAGGLHPAMVVGGGSDPKTPPVAIAGQVYVRITTESGPIRVGDLLVSSSTPGVAMRAADPARASGATLGKALQSFSSPGEGSIRMLVLNR